MNTKPKTKLLTISLLCCGRPDTTERCLKSLMPIREAIDSEIHVVDTGCDPETRAVIEKYADEVFEFKWVNDFAAARNFQLDQANGKMFLIIDDDEWFLDTKYIIEFFKEEGCTDYNIGGYFQRNYLDFEGDEWQDIEVVRMCTVTPETKWVGKVHEYIEPSYGNAIFMDARAGHFGYVYENEEENMAHSRRNVPLLKEMMEEQPNNLRWPFQLAQELRAIKDFEGLYDECKRGVEKTYEIDENDSIRYRATFVVGMAAALIELDRWDELIDLYNDQMSKEEIMEVPKAKLSLYAAKVLFMKLKEDECEKACNFYLDMMNKYKDDRGMIFMQGGIFINDVFDEYFANSIYFYLMGCGLHRDDYGPLARYYRKIAWNSKVVRINRGFLALIIKKSAENGFKIELNEVMKKMFTRPGLRDVLEHEIEDELDELTVEDLERLKENFKDTKGEKELKLFIGLRVLEKQLAVAEDYESYFDLLEILNDYARGARAWQDLHFEWMEPEAEKTVSAMSKLGTAIEKFVELSEDNPTEALKTIKDALGRRPLMDNSLNNLSRLYTNYQRVLAARKSNPEQFDQMYQLEEQLLQQIADLDAAGRTDEAISTFQQLTSIIVNTFGVESLHV